jgi:type II secretory pathway component PulF
MNKNYEPLTKRKKILGSLLSILPIPLYIGLYNAIPQFADIFSSFGAQLPALTRVFVSSAQYLSIPVYLSLMIFLVFIICSLASKPTNKLYIAVTWWCILSFLLFLFAMVAMYLPVFLVGNVV